MDYLQFDGGRELSHPRGGDCHMEKTGMLVYFDSNPYRILISTWLEFCLSHKRDHLKRNRLDYQLLFRKGIEG